MTMDKQNFFFTFAFMKRNTRDLLAQTGRDLKSISIIIALLGVLLGKFTIWNHIYNVENDIDYRELLSVMIGVLTTVVVTTYSLTIVALQLASVQFSPRILRSFFTEDRFNQVVLGSFIGEISYLLLLKTWSPKTLDLPIIAGLAMAILLICVVFPLFIAHIVDSINAGSIIRRISFHLLDEIDEHYGKDLQNVSEFRLSPKKTPLAVNVIKLSVCKNGYIESIDYQLIETIFQYAKNDAFAKNVTITNLYQSASVGEFAAEGIPLFLLESEPCNAELLKTIEKKLREDKRFQDLLQRCVKVGKYRSYRQDINFGIRQLVDIAIKAISPAVNDPTTCICSLDYLGMVLRRLVQSPPQCLAHANLPEYLHLKEFGFREYIDHALDQIYHFGQSDFVVVCRILSTLRSIIEVTQYEPYIKVLNAEYQDIKTDILKLEGTFTIEGFNKIKRELALCENALGL
jgi:uncharacterized membrane protein